MAVAESDETCKSCGATIEWARTEQRKWIPMDPGETPGSNLVVSDEEEIDAHVYPVVRYVAVGDGNRTTHFATCTHSKEHRKRRTKA